MNTIQTQVRVGRRMLLEQYVTLPWDGFSPLERKEIEAALGGDVILQTEHGPWRFRVTYIGNNVFSSISDDAPGQYLKLCHGEM